MSPGHVQWILEKWIQFFDADKLYPDLEEDNSQKPKRYIFYHESYTDYLLKQETVQQAGVSIGDINKDIAYLTDES